MRFLALAVLALGIGLFAACGGDVVVDGPATSTTTTTSTTGSTTTTAPVSCGGLDFCGCSHTDGCKVVYGDCICPCDYQCNGEPPCACACGGGPYFGCAPASCPGPFNFSSEDDVSFDEMGCPFVP